MTVREAVSVLYDAKTISLVWDNNGFQFIKDDYVMLDAYGNYKVKFIRGFVKESDSLGEAEDYEIGLALTPVREAAT